MATDLARKYCITKFQSPFEYCACAYHCRHAFLPRVGQCASNEEEGGIVSACHPSFTNIFSAFLSNYNFLITEIIVALSASNCLTCLPSRVTITKSFIRECTNVSVISRVFVASVRECIASVRHGNNYECYATDIMCYPDP